MKKLILLVLIAFAINAKAQTITVNNNGTHYSINRIINSGNVNVTAHSGTALYCQTSGQFALEKTIANIYLGVGQSFCPKDCQLVMVTAIVTLIDGTLIPYAGSIPNLFRINKIKSILIQSMNN